jgi:hypothetical protein
VSPVLDLNCVACPVLHNVEIAPVAEPEAVSQLSEASEAEVPDGESAQVPEPGTLLGAARPAPLHALNGHAAGRVAGASWRSWWGNFRESATEGYRSLKNRLAKLVDEHSDTITSDASRDDFEANGHGLLERSDGDSTSSRPSS